MTGGLLAGAARISVDPPPGLPMIGYVRRWQSALGALDGLEATAVAFDGDGGRVILVGVDTLGIQAPEADRLRERCVAAAGRSASVLLNWNHTHCAPAGGRSLVNLGGPMSDTPDPASAAYIDLLHDRIVDVVGRASAAIEPAWAVWGLGSVDEAVNRRERDHDGRVILGWNPEGLVDNQVPVLQARRPDGSAIATVVGFGCHTVTVGPDVLMYSADFPGPLRDAVRVATGGECVYLQGAAGNVLPRVAFTDDGREAARLGRRLALEALHALADRPGPPRRLSAGRSGSVTPFTLYRASPASAPAQVVAAAEERVRLPLLPRPGAEEIASTRAEAEARLRQAEAAGADPGVLNTIRYVASWAARTEADIAAGTAPAAAEGPVTAIRIGDGAIVTGPGEVSSEIGMAVRERSPAEVTLYAGYANGAVSYLPAASSYPAGGYEPGYGNRSYGLPSQVAPECDRILVETGLRLVASLFPERATNLTGDLLATGRLPDPPARAAWVRPHR